MSAESEGEVQPEGETGTEPEGTGGAKPEGEAEGVAEGEPEPEAEGTSEPEAPEPVSEGRSPVITYTFIVLYGLCIVLILVGNLVVAITVLKTRKLRTNTTNLYLVSLVTARASIGVFVVPARITGMFSEEYLGSILCKLCHFCAMGSATASVFSIVAIAIVKYHAVTSHTEVSMTMGKSFRIIGIIWLLGFAYAIRAPIFNDLNYAEVGDQVMRTCSVSERYLPINRYFIFVDIFCMFLVPFVLIVFCYSRVILHLGRSVASMEKDPDEALKRRQSHKAIQMLVILMILFTICTIAPMILEIAVVWVVGHFPAENIVMNSVYLFSYSNSWFNVIVFAVFRDDIREAFVQFACVRRCCRRHLTAAELSQETENSEKKTENNEALQMMEF